MAQQIIGIGTTANDGTGDPLRTAMSKTKDNFAELYPATFYHAPFIAGSWYFPTGGGYLYANSNALTVTVFYWRPWPLRATVTVQALGAYVATAGTNLQLAIYANNAATNRPTGSALRSTASIDVTTTGAKSAALSGGNLTLTPGLYWLGQASDSTALRLASQFTDSMDMACEIGSTSLAGLMAGSSASGPQTIVTTGQTFGTWASMTAATHSEVTTPRGGVTVFQAA